jgi:taurine dioxygenase
MKEDAMALEAAQSVDAIQVIPSGRPVGAEVRGVDFSKPVDAATRDRLLQIWGDHLVLLFRDQDLGDEDILRAADVMGGRQPSKSREYFLKAGQHHRLSKHAGINMVSNLDKHGKPVRINEGIGSLEATWHTDNSYIDVPPAGTFLWADILPVDGGGETSFTNMYQAYEELPDDLKQLVEGKHIRHDNIRNVAGRVRPTLAEPQSRDDITGPVHPIVRIHPLTGKRALYLGRRYEGMSSYIVELDDAESDAVLARLWQHATQAHLTWTTAAPCICAAKSTRPRRACCTARWSRATPSYPPGIASAIPRWRPKRHKQQGER